MEIIHASSCALHNGPALEPGPCDCGAVTPDGRDPESFKALQDEQLKGWLMVAMAKRGFDSKWGLFRAEGIVARPYCELKARNGDRIITKIKHRDFL